MSDTQEIELKFTLKIEVPDTRTLQEKLQPIIDEWNRMSN